MPRPPNVDPVRSQTEPPFDGWTESHPSYGVVGLARVSGRTRLFGSRVPEHTDYVTLRIHRADRTFSYGQERARATAQVVEIALSSVQLARLLTEMNMGDGVPCTLRYINREEMPEVPAAPVELHEARAQANEKVQQVAQNVQDRVAEVRSKLAGRVPKGVMADVEAVFERFLVDVKSNIPFYAKQVDEAAERASAAAQAEVDAYITSAVTRAGLRALQDPEAMRRLLGDPET